MMLRRPLAGLALLLAGCMPSAELTESHAAAIQDSVRAMLAEYESVAERLDLDAMSRYYADSPSFHWIEQGHVAYPTHDSLVATLQQFGGALASVEMSISDMRIVALGPGSAVASAAFAETLTFRDTTMAPLKIAGMFTTALRHTPDGWKFVAGHTSSVNPPPPPPPPPSPPASPPRSRRN